MAGSRPCLPGQARWRHLVWRLQAAGQCGFRAAAGTAEQVVLVCLLVEGVSTLMQLAVNFCVTPAVPVPAQAKSTGLLVQTESTTACRHLTVHYFSIVLCSCRAADQQKNQSVQLLQGLHPERGRPAGGPGPPRLIRYNTVLCKLMGKWACTPSHAHGLRRCKCDTLPHNNNYDA